MHRTSPSKIIPVLMKAPRFRSLFGVVLLFALSACQSAEKVDKPPESRQLRVYEVSDLVTPLYDSPLTEPGAPEEKVLNPKLFIPLDELVQNIRQTIAPKFWTNLKGPEETGGTIRVHKKHALVVNQTPEVHEQIEAYLTKRRKVGAMYVKTTVQIVRLDNVLLERFQPLQSGRIVSDLDFRSLTIEAKKNKDSAILGTQSVTLISGQEGDVTMSGRSVEIRPTLSADRKFVTATVRVRVDVPNEPERGMQSKIRVPIEKAVVAYVLPDAVQKDRRVIIFLHCGVIDTDDGFVR